MNGLEWRESEHKEVVALRESQRRGTDPLGITFTGEREIGFQVLLDDLVEGGLLATVKAIGCLTTSY